MVDSLSRGWQSDGMTTDATADPKGEDLTKQPQTIDELVWVQCKDFRCLAYTNKAGKWINFYTGKRLTGSVKIIG
jgi:hypothetical protein